MATRASSRGKRTFSGVVATPSKLDSTTHLQHEVDKLRKENDELKQRLAAIEVRLVAMEKCKNEEKEQMATMFTKAKTEVETTLTKEVKIQVQEVASRKVEDCVTATLRERQQQENIALNVRIGGLPVDWKGKGDLEYHEALPQLQAMIPM
ncbi:hypothetical protein L7F22_067187, partial [Adiantum nelumboides]|nr:hypothetical protein [Adiantum nelumboides]